MKKALFLIVFAVFAIPSFAQVADDLAGESFTYYDTLTRKKVKEVFHHKQVVQIRPDPKNAGEFIENITYVKNGAYMKYDENGKLQVEGVYREGKEDGVWTWYDPKGKVIKTVKYSNGVTVK